MTIFRYALLKGLRNPVTLLFNCILPLVIIFIPTLWDDSMFISGFGILALLIWGGAFLMSQGIMQDKESGAVVRILSAPVSMRGYLTQNLLAYMVPLTVQVGLIAVIGSIRYDWGLTIAFAFFLCYTIFTASSVAMSFAWNCLFKKKDSSFTTFSGLITFGSFLSGAYVPLDLLPEMVQHIGGVFPAFWAIRGIESVQGVGYMGQDYWIGLAVMALFTVAYLLYGGKRRIV